MRKASSSFLSRRKVSSECATSWRAGSRPSFDLTVSLPILSEDRIRKAVKNLASKRGVATQGRMDSFFKPVPKDPSSTSPNKRKVCFRLSWCLFYSSPHFLLFTLFPSTRPRIPRAELQRRARRRRAKVLRAREASRAKSNWEAENHKDSSVLYHYNLFCK